VGSVTDLFIELCIQFADSNSELTSLPWQIIIPNVHLTKHVKKLMQVLQHVSVHTERAVSSILIHYQLHIKIFTSQSTNVSLRY